DPGVDDHGFVERRGERRADVLRAHALPVESLERAALIGLLHDVQLAVDRLAETLLVGRDRHELPRVDGPQRGPLVGATEDAGCARYPTPAEAIGGVGIDVEALDEGPDLVGLPTVDGSPVVDEPRFLAVPEIRPIGLEDLVLGARGRLL